ncbi:MAG: efflux RND transporter permease subunit [Calditrichaeota bacterium]|nr:efflux RND transporter permease subunit [Calditrichota bacterium]
MLIPFLEKALHRPIGVSVIFVAGIVLGIFAILNMPLEVLPSVDYPRLYIETIWPGASPPMIEAEVTSLIEGEISQVRGIRKIKSYSEVGRSRIEVHLQRHTDVDYIRFFIQEKLSYLMEHFPPMVHPPRIYKYVPEEFKTMDFLSYHVVGPYHDARLREIAWREIAPVLRSIPGIAGVDVRGGRIRQIEILFDESQLRKWDLRPADIQRAIEEANLTRTLGHFVQGQQKIRLVVSQYLPEVKSIETLPILYRNGLMLRIKDVATVRDTLSPPYSIMRINGQETVLITLEREPGSNTIEVADRVYRIVERLQRQLPEGVKLIKEDDQSIEIRKNLRSLFYRASFSFLVVLLVLSLFIRDVYLTLLVQFSILVSVLCTLFILFLFNVSLNLITLAGLALGFGVLVDNSIVVSENILRLREQGASRLQACKVGVQEVFPPVLASTLTTVFALVPFLYFMEELRLYYLPFALTVSASLLVSMIVSFLFIPVAMFQLWKKLMVSRQTTDPSSAFGLISAITAGYRKVLQTGLRHPVMVVLLVVWLFGLPFWMLPDSIEMREDDPAIKNLAASAYNAVMNHPWMVSLRPYLNHLLGGAYYLFYQYVNRWEIWRWGEETRVQVYARLPSGTAIEETEKIARLLERTIQGEEGIDQLRTTIYPDFISMKITFLPQYEFSIVPFVVKEKLIIRATRIGNAVISVFGYGPGFTSGAQGISFMNRLVISGYNYADLERFSDRIKQELEKYPRVQNVRTDLIRRFMPSEVWEMGLRLHYGGMVQYASSGLEVITQLQPYLTMNLFRQRIRIGQQEVAYALQAQAYQGFQFQQLNHLQIMNRFGQPVRLGSMATLYRHRIPPVIEREDQQYYRIIAFDYLAPFQFAQRFVENFLKTVKLPAGYQIQQEQFGWMVSDKRTRNILFVLLLALVLMYMVLAGLYESFSYPFIIFLILPLSLIGVFLIYYLGDFTFSSSSYIGLIFMFGIILNNSILLLDHINTYRLRYPQWSFHQVLIQASAERVRPILMTSTTTILGLLPILIFQIGDSRDVWYNLAISTIGGLMAGTVLGLICIPVFALLFYRVRGWIRSAFSQSSGSVSSK